MDTKPFYRIKKRREALRREANTWPGTPWRNNSCVKGPAGAVSCDRLAAILAVESGHLPPIILAQLPSPPLRAVLAGGWSILLDYIDENLPEHFETVAPEENPSVGDLLLLAPEESTTPHHVVTYLGEQKFIHAAPRLGVVIRELSDGAYRGAVQAIRRPVERLTPTGP